MSHPESFCRNPCKEDLTWRRDLRSGDSRKRLVQAERRLRRQSYRSGTGRCGATPSDRTRAVRLSPSEQEKLLLSVAGMVARDRRARGVKLNEPEAVALLSCWVLEAARDGDRTVEQLMQAGREVLTRDDVMEGVPELVDEVQIEATFPDGRKLVTLHQPIQ